MNGSPPSAEQSSLFEQGVVIADRYEVVNQLGKGGMGLVLRVIDHALDNEPSAIKLLYPHHVKDPILFARFRNEVLVARQLAHPNIVRIYDFGSAGKGYYYISMEYVQGYSLKDRIYSPHYSDLDFPETCRILYEIGSGLAYAHRKGVIHRDIKPDNILMTSGGEVRISDFGLARTINLDKGFTQTGETVGTPCYMAPEQIRGEKVDGRADIYSLGILAYEMATGSRPFEDESWFALAKMHLQTPMPKFAREYDLPRWFEDLVLQSAEKKPADRFQTADEWVDALAQHIDPRNSKRKLSPAVFSSTFAASLLDHRKRKRARGTMFRVGAALAMGMFLCCSSILTVRAVAPLQRSALGIVAGLERSTGMHLSGLKNIFGLGSQGGQGALLAAVHSGNVDQARLLVAAGASPDVAADGEEAPIVTAIREKQVGIVKEFLSGGAHIDVKGKNGEPLIVLAASMDLPELFTPLLNRSPNIINERDATGHTALMYSAMSGNVSATQDLIANGALVSLSDQTPDALPVTIHAIKGGDLGTLQAILAKGQRSSANAADLKRVNALMYAAAADREDMIRALLSAGADPEARASDGKTFHDVLPAKLRKTFASIQPAPYTGETTAIAPQPVKVAAQTRLRLLDQPKIDWLIGPKTKIRSIQVVIRNAGDEPAHEVKITAQVPGGQLLQLRGPAEMTPNAVATFQAPIDPASPLDVPKVDKVDVAFVCSNCWK